MLTRCPHCHTAFRVTSEQLKVRQGQVRCGACSEVFDALESLADEVAAIVATQTAPETQADAEPLQEVPPVGPGTEVEPDGPPEPGFAPEPEPEPELPAETPPETESRPPQDGEPAPQAAHDEAAPDEAAHDEAALPDAWERVAETPPPRRWPWAVGLFAMLLLAAGQLAFIYRVELAVRSPELRPLLVAGCEAAGCSVPWPHRPELLGIENSDLEPAGGDRLLLTATLKNRAPFVQEVPHLELTLTDTQDDALLRKVLAPADWLPAGQPASAGFAAGGELAVRLLLEAPGVPAVGYRLYLFHP